MPRWVLFYIAASLLSVSVTSNFCFVVVLETDSLKAIAAAMSRFKQITPAPVITVSKKFEEDQQYWRGLQVTPPALLSKLFLQMYNVVVKLKLFCNLP